MNKPELSLHPEYLPIGLWIIDTEGDLVYVFEGDMTYEQLAIYIVSHRTRYMVVSHNGVEYDATFEHLCFDDVERNVISLKEEAEPILKQIWDSCSLRLLSIPEDA